MEVDISQKIFGKWRAVKRDSSKMRNWICECLGCNKIFSIEKFCLTSGGSLSCKFCCFSKERRIEIGVRSRKRNIRDLAGLKIGKWFVKSKDLELRNRNRKWICICECGIEKSIRENVLINKTNLKCQRCACIENARKGALKSIKQMEGQKIGRLKVLRRDLTRTKKIYWECLCECGKTKYISGENLRNKHSQSCGCLKEEMKGNKSPHWRHDLTQKEREDSKHRNENPQNRIWRNEVYKKNNYACKVCGQKDTVLNAHHLNGWRDFKEQRFDVDNGIALCLKCHKEFHRIYKNKQNTKEQFEEYLNKKSIKTTT